MQSEAINWSVAILLSLLVHSLVLMNHGARMGEENAIVLQAPIVTRLSFNQPSNDTPQDEPRPAQQQRVEPLKKVAAEPVLTKPAEVKPTVRQEDSAEKTEAISQLDVQHQARGKHVSHSSEGLLQKEREQYQHELMRHIESFKYYPRSARKRSLEGDVKVSLMLLDDGFYKQLMLDGEHSVLVKATRSAIESAAPFPLPPEDIALPWRLEFTMSYSLTH